MTTNILETIRKERLELEKWSEQVQELEQHDTYNHQNDLYECLKENIRNKLQLIEDLEFEALENQIALEEMQQKRASSSSSSPLSQSTGSDVQSATYSQGEVFIEMTNERIMADSSSHEASWSRVYQQPFSSSMNTARKSAHYEINEQSDCSKNDNDRTETLRYHYVPDERPSSVSSSVEPCNRSVNENSLSNFNRSHNPSLSTRSRSSFNKKNNSRPLTRYLPNPNDPRFNLKSYIEQCGHNLAAVENYVKIDNHSCCGHLLKLSGKRLKLWKKKSFIFDRNRRILAYYTGNKSTKLKGIVSFDQIINVQSVTGFSSTFGSMISSDTNHMFSIQLIDNFNRGRRFKEELRLSAQSAECQRIWMDVIFTGAEAYLKTLDDNRAQILRENNEPITF